MIEKKNKKSAGKCKLSGISLKLNLQTHSIVIHFNDEEWLKFLKMYEESHVYAKVVFLKAYFILKKLYVQKVDKFQNEYYAKLSDSHCRYRVIGSNYNQAVKELRSHLSEKKTITLHKFEKCTMELMYVTCGTMRLKLACLDMRELIIRSEDDSKI